MNLKDKMKSVSPEKKQNETNNEQNSSTNTTQKSKQPSREMELLEKQSEALKQVTEQRDKLLEEGRPEDQETNAGAHAQTQTNHCANFLDISGLYVIMVNNVPNITRSEASHD